MRPALLLVPLLLLTGACSGGDGDAAAAGATSNGPTAPPAVTKAAYLAKADAVCAKAVAAQRAAGTPTSADAIPGFVRKVVTIASGASAELGALEPPPADAAVLDQKLLTPLREQVALGQTFAKQVEQTAASGDTAGVLALLGSAPLQSKADLGWMRSYGFTACVDAADTAS